MKKKIIPVFILAAAMMMSACGASKQDTESETVEVEYNSVSTDAETDESSEDTESASTEESTETSTETTLEEGGSVATALSGCRIGDVVTFGSYEQDNDTSNGAEAIEWTVLDVQNGKALLLCNYVLDSQSYNDEDVAITWENCTLRAWLNDDFYNLAFSAEEQDEIAVTLVTADENPVAQNEIEPLPDPGNDTNDKVFLLSIKEVQKYFNLSDSDLENKTEVVELRRIPTAYAIANGAVATRSDFNDENAYSNWWLRSPGDYGDHGTTATPLGIVYYKDTWVHYTEGICPAIWVNV